MPGTIHLTYIATMVFHPENIFFRIAIWSGRQLHHSRRCWAQRRLNARRIHALCRWARHGAPSLGVIPLPTLISCDFLVNWLRCTAFGQ